MTWNPNRNRPDKSLLPVNNDASSAAAPNPRPLVLVVEDEGMIQDLLETILHTGGYQSRRFDCGDEVLAAPRELLNAAACAIVDDGFSGTVNGLETMAALHEINPRLKIVPLIGRELEPHELALITEFMADAIGKPFQSKDVLMAVAPRFRQLEFPGFWPEPHPVKTAALRLKALISKAAATARAVFRPLPVQPREELPLVLVVEDEPSLQQMMMRMLERVGYRTCAYDCGDAVLATPRQYLTEAVCAFVDDAFPGNLTGPQTVAMLHLVNPDLYIVPMTGREFTEQEEAWLAPFQPNTLFKPFRFDQVQNAVKMAVEAKAHRQST